MDFLKETYTITDVMEHMLDFERRTGESFFDFTLTQVNGKEIKVCREKEIVGGIVITDEYDLFIVQNEICLTIKRGAVMNMLANFDDFISEYNKDDEGEQ